MKAIGIIPARYASTRFPGKPLANIDGRSMIQRVYEQAASCASLDDVVVATDDERIYAHVAKFGKVVMTRNNHKSGTDRCLEALKLLNRDNKYTGQDVVVNIQGDEPFIDPGQIERVIRVLSDPQKNIASLMTPIRSREDVNNPNVVKVVCEITGKALYFSRAPIPFKRDASGGNPLPGRHYKHLGLYGYRISVLEKIVQLPGGKLEQTESLEQLRWLEHGYGIHMEETPEENISVDTPEDLLRITGKKNND